jgi:adenylosuccinate lyase
VVQRDAQRAWDDERPFADVLSDDPDVTTALTPERLAACFDLDRALQHATRAVDALA